MTDYNIVNVALSKHVKNHKTSSLRNPKVGFSILEEMYQNAKSTDVSLLAFREYCILILASASYPDARLITQVRHTIRDKNDMAKRVGDFLLAGLGFKVIA